MWSASESLSLHASTLLVRTSRVSLARNKERIDLGRIYLVVTRVLALRNRHASSRACRDRVCESRFARPCLSLY